MSTLIVTRAGRRGRVIPPCARAGRGSITAARRGDHLHQRRIQTMTASLHVVTGGAGFIGSHLVRALLAEGYRVRIVDDFSTGKWSNVSEGVELLEGDAGDLAARAV